MPAWGGNMSRILVVEDEENIADYLVTGLREEGYAVEPPPTGSPAGIVCGPGRGTSYSSTGGSRGSTGWSCSAASAIGIAGRRSSS